MTSKIKTHIIELNKGLKDITDVSALSLKDKWRLFITRYRENRGDPVLKQLIESEEIFQKAMEVLEVVSEDQKSGTKRSQENVD